MGTAAVKTELRTREQADSLCLLIISDGVVATHKLPPRGRVVIGRAEDSTIVVSSNDLSRHHVALELGESIVLEDLGSTNGTRVRDKVVTTGQRLELVAGDAIELGSTIALLQYLPAPSAQPRVHAATAEATSVGPVIRDPAMVALFRIVDRLAPGTLPVLVLGETGAGKEVVAEQLHARSARSARPLVRLNCAAFTEQLLESELFGHVRGAFTGATEHKEGLIVAADGGTVFLDEIGELPLVVQAKLLRVLENREVLPIGALRPVQIDVRFVAATNRDLTSAIDNGLFRADLYHRLDGATLVVPPLRERPSEIRPLALRFLNRAARSHRVNAPVLSDAAMTWLETHRWPGNIRELRNTIERAVLVAEAGVIDVDHLATVRVAKPVEAVPTTDDDAVRLRTLSVLASCNGNQTRAARALGIARSTLVKRLDAYGAPRPQKG